MKSNTYNLGYLFCLLSVIFSLSVMSCTHDDEIDSVIDPPNFTYGDDIVNADEGWSFDQNHSNIRWETFYLGSGALLTGRFNEFEMEIDFDEDNPENTSLMGRVILSTVNTGEPGRDEGCLLETFETEVSDEAIFTSTNVEFDDEGGYLVTGNLTFHGVTDEVILKLNYIGTTFFDEDSGFFGAPFYLAGFTGEFQMNAKTVFGIESGNIADLVVVKVNGNFKKAG